MILIVAGLLLLALGMVCGAILVLGPLGVIPADAGASLWVLFPVFTVGGYLMAAAPARDARLPALSKAMGALLLLLALVAAAALVLQGSGMIEARGGTLSLWYVLAIGLVVGSMALASHRKPSGETRPGV